MRTFAVIGMILLSCLGRAQTLDIFFEYNRYDLNDGALMKLDRWLSENPDAEVTKLYGYCDWKGRNAYNDSLSLKRIRTVYEYLLSKNVTVLPDYEAKGYGEDFEQSPIQAENRKVLISWRQRVRPPIKDPSKAPGLPEVSELRKLVSQAKEGDVVLLPQLYFFNNSARLVPKSEPVLYELLCILRDNPTLKVEIRGHICCQPKEDINNVSTARAKAVFQYLLRNKITRNRLTYKGYGIQMPIHPIPEQDAGEENDNRRVDIRIISK